VPGDHSDRCPYDPGQADDVRSAIDRADPGHGRGHRGNDGLPLKAQPFRAKCIDGGKGASVILVLNQYSCIGCSPGKHPDTRTMATGSDDDSRDSVHDRCLCIAV
jgi:hypothetical protein